MSDVNEIKKLRLQLNKLQDDYIILASKHNEKVGFIFY